MDQRDGVNMTAEEEVDDDEEIPDLRTLKLNTENAHLLMDQANGETHYSLMDFAASNLPVKIKHS